MRIVKRSEFLNLPEGTIFSKGREWFFDGLCTKGETLFDSKGLPIDFLARDWIWISSTSEDDQFDRLYEMKESGASYPIKDSEHRDGCFNDDDLFLIFEHADLLVMKSDIENALFIQKDNMNN